ncbi:MFS transporter [Salicibibacter cibarius]|uniref:MFS transporter n=1 Tax=Salicibibacter cibarius TaxID=2743000 RepID=A0A7T6Z6G0_9BACI|nr:MFS transporter [Salicibibacter cibarius]QQK77740.1 MFS transporter [Salicibibacter cibarius]
MSHKTIEDVPFNKFHLRMFGVTSGSAFIDGYAIGIIAIAMAVFETEFQMSALMMGLMASSLFIGMFFGGAIFGYVTDIIGRKKMFILDTIIILITSILMFFVTEALQLVVLRIILGIAVGADYPIAGSLMGEFSPKKRRGAILGGMIGLWFVGYALSYVVGYLMLPIGDDSWRWMLISVALPAIILLIARIGMPESPLWLASKGRMKEAQETIKKFLGEGVSLPKEATVPKKKTSYIDIFKNGYGRRTVFLSLFWCLQVAPLFAIGLFIPQILAGFGAVDDAEFLGSAVINVLYLLGILPALYAIEKWGRRPVLTYPFLISGICIAVLGIMANYAFPFVLVLTIFVIYGIFNTGMQTLQWIYPNELFPTNIRATAFGFASGFSRVGAASSTFVFPLILDTFGLQATLFFCAGLYFIGWIISLTMAPETKNMTLEESSSVNINSDETSIYTQAKETNMKN